MVTSATPNRMKDCFDKHELSDAERVVAIKAILNALPGSVKVKDVPVTPKIEAAVNEYLGMVILKR